VCVTTVALVPAHDAGVDGGEAVTHEEVLAVFAQNIDGLKSVLRSALSAMPAAESDAEATCGCRRALDGITLPFELPG
jgi:5'-methylthioadenosine phosphorylase